MTELAKLTITPESASNFDPIEVLFNPNTYSITKTVSWTAATGSAQSGAQTERRKNAPALQFGGGQSRALSLDLFFDTTEETDAAKVDVRQLTNKIVKLTRIVRDLDPQRPPVCVVSWGKAAPPGSDFPFTGVVTQLTQRFNLFLPDGTPVRANLTVAFTEYLDPTKDELENDPEFTTRLVKRRDTLSSIAGEVYGDPTLWRIIAEANSLDDPRQVPAGLRLNIPKVRCCRRSLGTYTAVRFRQIDLLINGTKVPAATMRYVEDVVVDDSMELPSMFCFAMTSSDAQEKDSPWVDNEDLFSIGNVVEIKMSGAGELTSLIIGEITALEPEFLTSRLPVLKVRGYDRRHRLQRGRKTRTFLQKKDSDIATQIGSEAGLSVQATDTSTSLDYMLQANQTDWEFLCERARLIRYELVVRDKDLFFQPAANDATEVLTLDMQNDLLEFYPRLSSSGQATEVKVQSWSVKDKKAMLGDSKAGDEVSTMGGQSSGAAIANSAFGDAIEVVSDQPVATRAEADQLAKARFNDLVLDLITGEGICRGRPDILAGKVIKIDGIGQRFGGQYYVTSAIHRYAPTSGYVTEFMVRRNAS